MTFRLGTLPSTLAAITLLAICLGCSHPWLTRQESVSSAKPDPAPAPEITIEPGCHLVDGAGKDDAGALPTHFILTSQPSPESAERYAVRLRRAGEKVDDAGWWHRTESGVLALLDPKKSGGTDRWTIDVEGGEIRAHVIAAGRARSLRLHAGCD